MNAAEKQAIRDRADAASSGPWYVDPNGVMFDVVYNDRDLFPDGPIAVAGGDHHGACLIEDAEFIAAARTDVPILLAALNKAEARAVAVRAMVSRVEALHVPVEVWQYDDTDGVFGVDDLGEHIVIARLCRECSTDDALEALGDCEWTEDTQGSVFYPCATRAALGVEE